MSRVLRCVMSQHNMQDRVEVKPKHWAQASGVQRPWTRSLCVCLRWGRRGRMFRRIALSLVSVTTFESLCWPLPRTYLQRLTRWCHGDELQAARTDAVFTRDTFTWGKLTFLLYCVTFSAEHSCDLTAAMLEGKTIHSLGNKIYFHAKRFIVSALQHGRREKPLLWNGIYLT